MVFLLLGLITPFVMAIIIIFATKQESLKKSFFKKLVEVKRIDVNFLPLFLLLMPISVILSILLSSMFGESLADQLTIAEGFSFSTGFVPVLLLLLLAAIFEELGWRGYGFESLRAQLTFFQASILFSVLWSLWHLPLIFVNHSYQYEILQANPWYAINFFISIIPMGMIISWVCHKNNGSILAAILFHFLINISQEAFEITQTTKIIQTFVLFFIAFIIIFYNKELYFRSQSKEFE